MSDDAEIQAAIEGITAAQRARAVELTQPVFTADAGREREVTASGVLLSVGPHVALVSARHALGKQPGRSIHFGAHRTLHELAGRSRRTREDEGREPYDDRLDLTVVLLDSAVADSIDRRYVVPVTACEPAHALERRSLFLAAGYPYSKQGSHRHRNENAATAHQFLLEREALATYATLGLDPAASLLLHLQRSDFYRAGSPSTAPKPVGMSGGAVWRLDVTPDAAHGLSLAGFIVEHLTSPKHVMVATRAWVAVSLLLELAPSLRRWIPQGAADFTSPDGAT